MSNQPQNFDQNFAQLSEQGKNQVYIPDQSQNFNAWSGQGKNQVYIPIQPTQPIQTTSPTSPTSPIYSIITEQHSNKQMQSNLGSDQENSNIKNLSKTNSSLPEKLIIIRWDQISSYFNWDYCKNKLIDYFCEIYQNITIRKVAMGCVIIAFIYGSMKGWYVAETNSSWNYDQQPGFINISPKSIQCMYRATISSVLGGIFTVLYPLANPSIIPRILFDPINLIMFIGTFFDLIFKNYRLPPPLLYQ